MQIRRARIDDLSDLFSWRNESHARKMFRNQAEVSLEEHSRWLLEKLQDKESFIFIGEEMGLGKVGVCRIQKSLTSMDYEISVVIAKELRGRGMGHKLIRLGISTFWLEIKSPIIAWVHRTNFVSAALFTNLGFSAIGVKQGDFAAYRLEFEGLI